MKRVLALAWASVWLVLGSAVSGHAQGAAGPSGLVAAYSFDEGSGPTVTDRSGNGNTGTITGAAWTSLGRFGGALAFNGVDSWITIECAPSLDLSTGMTLEAWVYPTVSLTAWRTVMAKEGAGNIVAYYLHASSSPNNEPATGLTIGTEEEGLGAGVELPVNTWTHLAGTYDGAALRFYVNGVEVAARAHTGSIVNTFDPLRIGGNSVWGEYFEGVIDEVRIYDRALSQAEIHNDMNTPISAPPNPAPTTTGLNPAAATAGGPAFSLTVTGTNFISGSRVRWNGVDRETTYVSATEVTAAIPATDIAVAGTTTVTVLNPAPGGGTSNAQTLTISAPSNPVPTTTGLTPSSTPVGGFPFTLTVTGTNFIPGSRVRWNGADRETAYVSATQVTAAIPFRDIAVAGTAAVTVFNPEPGGGTSNAQTFTILPATNPVPTITELVPASRPAGGAAFTLSVVGTKFVDDSVVRWNGVDRPTTFVSSTHVRLEIPSVDIAEEGTATVTVFTRGPGGGTSNPQTLTITPTPTPTLTGMLPTSMPAGRAAFTLQVGGLNDFVPRSVVRWNGADRPTTFLHAALLTAEISPADIAAAGTVTVTVFTPGPGGGTSNGLTFTITPVDNPLPGMSGASPIGALQGGPAFTMTVQGRNFTPSSVVRWNGTDRPTTFIDAIRLTAAITAADIAEPGTAVLTVFTPAPGGGTSDARFFSITPSGDFFDDFDRPDSGELDRRWVQKTPGAFAMAGGRVTKAATATGFADNLVYRPAIENLLHVEASVEVRFDSLPPGYAQVFVRGQTDTIANAGVFSGYLLFTNNDPGRAALSRVVNGAFVPLADITIDPALNTTDTFRLRLRATGTDPVELAAFVERFTGTSWTVVGQTTVDDGAPTRLSRPGTVGFTGYVEGGVYTYDNFTRTIALPNQRPRTTGLVPAAVVAGAPGFTLTVTGSGFVAGSVVRWNGTDRPTSYVSATQLSVEVAPSDVGVTGTAQVTVFNPAPGGGPGNVQYFSVLDPGGVFVDTFDRPDSADLGNGWTEKYPSAFAIQNNEVVLIDTGLVDYHDAIAYRPVGEDLRDVEVGLEFRVLSDLSFPQVHARVQRNTIAQANTLEGYMLFVDGSAASPGRAVIAHQAPVPGQFQCYMLAIPFPGPLQQSDRYRLRLRVVGSNPVTLTGFVERFDGTAWEVFASGSVVHDGNTLPIPGDSCASGFMPAPITTAGAVGFAKWRTANEVLDNFSWTGL